MDHGFFYLVNHGIGEDVFKHVFEQSRRFFSLSSVEKMKLGMNCGKRGYSPMYAEKLDTASLKSKGFHIALDIAFMVLFSPAHSNIGIVKDLLLMNTSNWRSSLLNNGETRKSYKIIQN